MYVSCCSIVIFIEENLDFSRSKSSSSPSLEFLIVIFDNYANFLFLIIK